LLFPAYQPQYRQRDSLVPWPLEKAMALANRAGGIVVGKLGTATVTSEELQ